MSEETSPKNLFTFGVLVYNQEKIVLETLESIKYQIIQYGQNYNVEILITDDCSKDNSVAIIDKWLQKNKGLFINSKFFKNETNLGIVKNYNLIMNASKGNHIKVIAGDDVFSYNNFFDVYFQLYEDKIISCFPLYLCDGKILLNDHVLFEFFIKANKKNRSKRYNMRKIRQGWYFYTPTTLYQRKLYKKSNCENENAKFFLYEDDPTYYAMFKNNKDTKVEFLFDVIVLYRISSLSVCHGLNPVFMDEAKRLHDIFIHDEKNVFFKIYLYFKHSLTCPKYLNISKYVDGLSGLIKKIYLFQNKDFKQFKNAVEKEVKKNQKYYDFIQSKVEGEEKIENFT